MIVKVQEQIEEITYVTARWVKFYHYTVFFKVKIHGWIYKNKNIINNKQCMYQLMKIFCLL